MQQVVLLEPGRFALRDVAPPRPGEGEALVRVHRIGVCGTDLHAYAGRQPFFTYPRVLGHELAVTVEAVPAGDTRVRIGDLCAVRPFLNDPQSRATLRGRPNCCESLRVLGVHVDGGMGELLAVETRFLHPVPDLDQEAAALIEPLSIGCHAVGRGRPTPEDRTLVIGAGPIGLAAAYWARRAGAGRVAVVARSRRREALAMTAGADAFLTSDVEGGVPAAAAAALGGAPEHVIECAGMPGMLELAVNSVARRGLVSVLGLCATADPYPPAVALIKEVDLRYSVLYDLGEYQISVDALERDGAPIAAMVTETVSLDQLPATFDQLLRGAPQCKVQIDPWAAASG